MGAVANMRPDLFRAIVSHVPFVDVMNTMLDASLPLTVPEYEEWGDPNEEKYFNYMLSYSPYDNLRAASYPGDAGKDQPARQPGDVLGAGEVCGQAAHAEDGLESAAAGDEYAGRARRRERALRLPERDCAGLCVFAEGAGSSCNRSGRSAVSCRLTLHQRLLQARGVFNVQRLESRIDLLEQAAEHFARTDFDEQIGAGGF